MSFLNADHPGLAYGDGYMSGAGTLGQIVKVAGNDLDIQQSAATEIRKTTDLSKRRLRVRPSAPPSPHLQLRPCRWTTNGSRHPRRLNRSTWRRTWQS